MLRSTLLERPEAATAAVAAEQSSEETKTKTIRLLSKTILDLLTLFFEAGFWRSCRCNAEHVELRRPTSGSTACTSFASPVFASWLFRLPLRVQEENARFSFLSFCSSFSIHLPSKGVSGKFLKCSGFFSVSFSFKDWAMRRALSAEEMSKVEVVVPGSFKPKSCAHSCCSSKAHRLEQAKSQLDSVSCPQCGFVFVAIDTISSTKFRCRECLYGWCISCKASPYHDDFSCAAFAERARAPKCRFCAEPIKTSVEEKQSFCCEDCKDKLQVSSISVFRLIFLTNVFLRLRATGCEEIVVISAAECWEKSLVCNSVYNATSR